MILTLIYSFLLLSTNALAVPAGGEDASFTLRVELSGADLSKGTLMVAVFDQADDFLSKRAVHVRKIKSKELKDGHFDLHLPKGQYAMAVYLDINENEKLDQNFFRFPTEPYGFSNNPSISMGPPSYEKAAFTLEGDMKISIRLQ